MNLKMTIANLFPFLVMILIFYVLLIMPQQKQMKERKKMLSNLKVGDKVVTISGIFGIITYISGEEIEVKMLRSAVQNLVNTEMTKAN